MLLSDSSSNIQNQSSGSTGYHHNSSSVNSIDQCLIQKSSSRESLTHSHYDADDEYSSRDIDDSDSSEAGINEGQLKLRQEKLIQRQLFIKRLTYVVIVDFTLLCILIPIIYVLYYLPSFKLSDSKFFAYWYYYFQLSKYLVWMVVLVIGFAYVALITENRSHPFHCRYNRSRDFVQLMVAATLLYWIGPSRTLMAAYDPEEPGVTKAFLFNYFFFTVPYVLGLHYTYLDKIDFLQIAGDKFGTPSLWKTYKVSELCLIVPVICGIVALVVYHCYLIIAGHLALYFVVAYVIYFGVLVGVTYALRKTHHLHLHHYFIFGSLIPFTAFQTWISSISLGLLSGIMTEGVSRWSMANMWSKGEYRVL